MTRSVTATGSLTSDKAGSVFYAQRRPGRGEWSQPLKLPRNPAVRGSDGSWRGPGEADHDGIADPTHTPYTGGRWARRQEERAYAQHPDFLPMLEGFTGLTESTYHRYIVGYDLAALRAGTVRVLGHRGDFPETGAELRPVADSLLGWLHDAAAEDLWIRRAQLEDPTNFGFGSIGDEQVEEAVEQLREVELLQGPVDSYLRMA